jgi:peptide deformylase
MGKNLFILTLLGSSLLFFHCKKENEISLIQTPVDSLAFSAAEKALINSGTGDSIMHLMNFFVYADSLVLRTRSKNVNLNDTTTLFHLIDRMFATVKDPANPGVGIAAPQVGICRNIIWVQRYDKGTITNHPWEIYLNPRIARYSDTTEFRADGCLSIPGVSKSSRRAIWVDVEYDLPNGAHFTEHISHKYTAHIFQHEIDHLLGIMFIDRLY